MQIRRKSKLTSEVSTSSLNDIMFFLLLFFLIASTMANPNVIKVLLPKADTGQVMNTKQVSLTIKEDLEYILQNKPISREELKTELEKVAGTNKEVTVVLNIDSKVDWEYVVEALDIGKALNIKMVAAARKK
jgi:biopolymer transport protein ExbD